MHGRTAVKVAAWCGIVGATIFIMVQRVPVKGYSSNYFIGVSQNQTNPVDKLSYGFRRQTNNAAKLNYGFQWVNADATISVDLNINDTYTAMFLELLYFTQSKRIQIKCPKEEVMGGSERGVGWAVCVSKPYNLVPPCLVYSIGLSHPRFWGFDRTVTNKYGCQNMGYDPTTRTQTHRVDNLMWFFNVGLGGKDGITTKNWRIKTLETILKDNNHTQTTIDILKIDIECAEFTAFDAVLANPWCLDNVKQLMIEFHPCEILNTRGNRILQSPELLSCWRTIRGIDKIGFKLWKFYNNLGCWLRSRRLKGLQYYACWNAYYINIKYLL